MLSALLSARVNSEFKDTAISLEPATSSEVASIWQGLLPRGAAVINLAATLPVQLRTGAQVD